LRQLYFDTVLYTEESLGYLVKQMGSDHVLLGTDYPADMGEADPLGYIGKVRSLSREDKINICGGNAARLLNISP
jgi:aminocarboxymuconate-semialdehyde decarboxylase